MTSCSPTRAPVFGCCDFQIISADNKNICGRSMEFYESLKTSIIKHNRGEVRQSIAPDGSPGYAWVSKYGFAAFNAFYVDDAVEGMNEKGLSFGALTLDSSTYQTVSEGQNSIALAVIDVGCWILGTCATVDDVKAAIPQVRIWGNVFPALNAVPGLHLAIHDANRNNLVIEFIDGEAILKDNPMGVLTNDPVLESQLQNLQNYNNLQANIPPPSTINGVTISNDCIGSGMQGIPGSWTSQDRFVKVSKMVEFLLQPEDANSAINAGFHILNTVDIPEGLSGVIVHEKQCFEITRWSVVKNLTDRQLVYRVYNDLTPRIIDIAKSNFAPGTPQNKLPIETADKKQTFINMTHIFNS